MRSLLNFKNLKDIRFINCSFRDFQAGVFVTDNVDSIYIYNSYFKDCYKKISWMSVDDIVGNLNNAKELSIIDTTFENCLGKYSHGGIKKSDDSSFIFADYLFNVNFNGEYVSNWRDRIKINIETCNRINACRITSY